MIGLKKITKKFTVRKTRGKIGFREEKEHGEDEKG